jgi:protein-tyrosine sulfotransferase
MAAQVTHTGAHLPRDVQHDGNGLGSVAPSAEAQGPSARAGQAPVIVLTMARSGSTLLRFILDSHPELACPPETSLGSACHMMARLWDLLEPSPQSVREGFRPHQVPASLPDPAVASIRGVLDEVYGRYLARHQKQRWCDKSLDNTGIAGLLADIYPEAQFVCLYRHCMDVIVSAVEACPWGLAGYGFDQYTAATQGNSVAAVAMCWLDRTRPIIEFQEAHPGRCHGIRYEDLVTAPEEVTESLFDFLGVRRVPGITADCFAADHEIRGPGDHKIWFTDSISRQSLGQGIRVPVGALPPDMLAQINQTLAQLDYRPVDDQWTTAAGPLDPRTGPEAPQDPADPAAVEAAAALSARLALLVAEPAADMAARWPASQRLTLVIRSARHTGKPLGWQLSCDDSGLTIREGTAPDPEAATITATGATWLAILTGQANLAVMLRAGQLRVTRPAADHLSGDPAGLPAEMPLLAWLLGPAATRSPAARPARPQPGHPPRARRGRTPPPARDSWPPPAATARK